MLDLYIPGQSALHRLAPGWKILGLLLAGSLLFAIDQIGFSLLLGAITLGLYALAGFGPRQVWTQLRPALWVFALIFLAQVLFIHWLVGIFVIIRFAVLLLLAGLLTLTTRSSEILDGFEKGMAPMRRFGVPTEKVSLAISLTLRFIPVLAAVVQEVREAQRTRGLERNLVALALPSLIRTLRMSEEISDAIDARGF